ncbi:MAG: nucleoside recognition domain-containing protein [Clostridia bacterium]
MSAYVIPILIVALFIFAKLKKVDCYASFVDGAKKSLELCKSIFPYLAAILISVAVLKESGALNSIVVFCSPALNLFGIPHEITELILLRPFTGSGSIAILKTIIAEHGADSYISRCASTIMGSSETVFYVASIYFSKTQVKRLLYAIPVALVCTFVSAILSCVFCSIF